MMTKGTELSTECRIGRHRQAWRLGFAAEMVSFSWMVVSHIQPVAVILFQYREMAGRFLASPTLFKEKPRFKCVKRL